MSAWVAAIVTCAAALLSGLLVVLVLQNIASFDVYTSIYHDAYTSLHQITLFGAVRDIKHQIPRCDVKSKIQ